MILIINLSTKFSTPQTLTPLTKKRFDLIVKRIKELDKYATV